VGTPQSTSDSGVAFLVGVGGRRLPVVALVLQWPQDYPARQLGRPGPGFVKTGYKLCASLHHLSGRWR
jgi:hypothetical protein